MEDFIFAFFGVIAIIIVAMLYWFLSQTLTYIKFMSILLEEIAFGENCKEVEKTFNKPTPKTPQEKQDIIMAGWGI